jgi:hypothetical protein
MRANYGPHLWYWAGGYSLLNHLTVNSVAPFPETEIVRFRLTKITEASIKITRLTLHGRLQKPAARRA